MKTTDLIEKAEEKSLLASIVNSGTVITDELKGELKMRFEVESRTSVIV